MNDRRTEADLEARIHTALGNAFPWLAGKLEHQTCFSIKLGHATVRVDGRRADELSGRADILVLLEAKPLIVLELKREGLALTDDDVTQGLSYARLTAPMTPLVLVTNGADVRIHVTHSGEVWSPSSITDESLRRRLASAVHLASAEVREAITTLMGVEQQHWVEAVRAISEQLVEDRTGDWKDSMSPFVRDFLLPRHATVQIIGAIDNKHRVIVVHGPPLSGKSNILRELIQRSQACDNLGVLMLEPTDAGVFAEMANILASRLDWRVSSDDAREWLRRISAQGDAVLVIALDGVDPVHARVLADLNELASPRFGLGLRLVVTVDDSAVEAIVKKPTGRENTALGRAMWEVPLLALDDTEFEHALEVLATHRIQMTPGGESVLSLRQPWILRTLVPVEISEMPTDRPNLAVRLPPMLDIRSLQRTAKEFAADSEAEVALRSAAGAIVDEYVELRNFAAVLQGITTFAVSKQRLELAVGEGGMGTLRSRGLLKPGINWAEEPVWYVRVPALIAMHVAAVISGRMTHWGNPDETANRLVELASKLPLGELIAAIAVMLRTVDRVDRNPLELLSALLQRSPTTSTLNPGATFAFVMRGSVIEARVSEAGKLIVPTQDSVLEIDLEEGEPDGALSDPGGWLILSHIASIPMGIDMGEGVIARLDEPLLMEIGQSPVVLSRPDGEQDFKEIVIHEIDGHGSVVCHNAGVVEPITWALVQYFVTQGSGAASWVDDAVAKSSLPLLMRMHIALRQIADLSDARGDWARSTLAERVRPALSDLPMHH